MARRVLNVEKITLSLPRDLVHYADKRAAQLATSRSQVVSDALAERRAREEEELAREGYAYYAAESEEFAAISAKAVSEVFGHAG